MVCKKRLVELKKKHHTGVQSPGAKPLAKLSISYRIAEAANNVLFLACEESKKDKPDTKRHARLMQLRQRLAKLELVAVNMEKELRALGID